MKVRRSNRLVDMTRYLMEHPRTLVSLKFFGERYGSAKSSINPAWCQWRGPFDAALL